METTVNYQTNVPVKPDSPDFKVGQYWKHRDSGDIYIIGGDCGKYVAICLTGHDRDKGDSYDFITDNIDEVFDIEDFEFVPSITISIP